MFARWGVLLAPWIGTALGVRVFAIVGRADTPTGTIHGDSLLAGSVVAAAVTLGAAIALGTPWTSNRAGAARRAAFAALVAGIAVAAVASTELAACPTQYALPAWRSAALTIGALALGGIVIGGAVAVARPARWWWWPLGFAVGTALGIVVAFAVAGGPNECDWSI